jgi:hypothetical protein
MSVQAMALTGFQGNQAEDRKKIWGQNRPKG